VGGWCCWLGAGVAGWGPVLLVGAVLLVGWCCWWGTGVAASSHTFRKDSFF